MIVVTVKAVAAVVVKAVAVEKVVAAVVIPDQVVAVISGEGKKPSARNVLE